MIKASDDFDPRKSDFFIVLNILISGLSLKYLKVLTVLSTPSLNGIPH